MVIAVSTVRTAAENAIRVYFFFVKIIRYIYCNQMIGYTVTPT